MKTILPSIRRALIALAIVGCSLSAFGAVTASHADYWHRHHWRHHHYWDRHHHHGYYRNY